MPGAGGAGRSQSVEKFFENLAVASGPFPHSIECGPIEALSQCGGAMTLRYAFLHSIECGPIEAIRINHAGQ